MKRFIEGLDRSQTTLFPECIDDYVDADNPVRAIDAFVDMLDLAALGFDTEPEATGRPGTIQRSSRRLERECARNLELIWQTGRLAPDFKTIADFRRNNGPAIRKVCQQFVALCRDIALLDASIVAIDGSKFKAVNAKAKSYTREKIERRLGEIDAAIARYLGELDRADEVHEKTGMLPQDARLARVYQETRALSEGGAHAQSHGAAHPMCTECALRHPQDRAHQYLSAFGADLFGMYASSRNREDLARSIRRWLAALDDGKSTGEHETPHRIGVPVPLVGRPWSQHLRPDLSVTFCSQLQVELVLSIGLLRL